MIDIGAHGGSGTVEYEDGHNAYYVADFTYDVNVEGRPEITSFKIRAQRDTI